MTKHQMLCPHHNDNVVELEDPNADKFDACTVAHMNEIGISTVLESYVMRIESLLL